MATLSDNNTKRAIQYQGLREKINRQGVCIWEYRLEGFLLPEWQSANVIAGTTCGYGVKLIQGWCSKHIEDQSKLMVIIASREERLSRQHLREDAPDRPDINGLIGRTVNKIVVGGARRRTLVYCLNVSIISGARYHRVATYSVMNPVSVPDGSAVFTDRANPKSQTLRSQLAFNRRFDGLRSRCMTSAECSALSARNVW